MQHSEVVIVGSGFAGLCMGVRLKQAGIDDFVILEQGREIGGTWRDNRYPGLTCDVPSHAYTYSFEPYPEWQAYYAAGGEIQTYFEMVAAKYGVLDHFRFNSEVTGAHYDDATARWTITLANGWVLALPEMAAETRLPITVEARKVGGE